MPQTRRSRHAGRRPSPSTRSAAGAAPPRPGRGTGREGSSAPVEFRLRSVRAGAAAEWASTSYLTRRGQGANFCAHSAHVSFRSMIVLTVCNHKGGTGKTTSVIHLAAALGLSGFRTLAVDFDPQCFLTHMLGLEEPPESRSPAGLFDGQSALRDVPPDGASGTAVTPTSRPPTRPLPRR